MQNKIFLILPDGIGLRNFAYGDFPEQAKKTGIELCYWNQTAFPLKEKLGEVEIPLKQQKLHPLTTIYGRARKKIELGLWKKQWNDAVYETYLFPDSYKGLKNAVKSVWVNLLVATHNSPEGLKRIVKKIKQTERKTDTYKHCLKTLQQQKPNLVFCTNQRASTALAPLLATQDLNIPTACFIFSWDNLPKATMVIETDYYFVWSDYMKEELLRYYPQLSENQIIVCGSPQFANHFDKKLRCERTAFFKENGLDPQKKYLCFSGDDVTTSPDDPQYLEDTARAVEALNAEGENLGILFRRCPVDISGRYDSVLKKYDKLIVAVAPKWEALGEVWNQIFPMPEDLALLANTVAHCEAVINLGSSMVFDFAAQGKPCIFINYDAENKTLPDWSVEKIYKYIHFRSMPNKEVVLWAKSPFQLNEAIKTALSKPQKTVQAAQDWMQVINLAPHDQAVQRICEGIKKIIQ